MDHLLWPLILLTTLLDVLGAYPEPRFWIRKTSMTYVGDVERGPYVPQHFRDRFGNIIMPSDAQMAFENENSSFTTVPPYVRGLGSAAMFTPPARFNNNILPTFSNTTTTNVTVLKGKTVYLHCHVLNLGTKTVSSFESETRTVSWVRHQDIHVLTVGRITFTNDDRFQAMNKPGSDIWMLRIKFPQLEDAGKYECQVSMKPPIARVINLNVIEPQAVIPPGPELYVDHGSPLNISCLVPDSPVPPENIFWYHKDMPKTHFLIMKFHPQMVSFDGSRQGVTINVEKGPITTSNLFIPDVTEKDSGIYVCSPQGMKEAAVRVRVLNGELPQAMQTGSTCKGCAGSFLVLIMSVIYHVLL
ncbi:hypothetical protein SK128_010652 [Halocaridina rubra]|uniref:Ig-like domain-containing protein n=1 Tax=Halocaridina rubra TaxID=373956 RepID=A0AAN9A542_HALRR